MLARYPKTHNAGRPASSHAAVAKLQESNTGKEKRTSSPLLPPKESTIRHPKTLLAGIISSTAS